MFCLTSTFLISCMQLSHVQSAMRSCAVCIRLSLQFAAERTDENAFLMSMDNLGEGGLYECSRADCRTAVLNALGLCIEFSCSWAKLQFSVTDQQVQNVLQRCTSTSVWILPVLRLGIWQGTGEPATTTDPLYTNAYQQAARNDASYYRSFHFPSDSLL